MDKEDRTKTEWRCKAAEGLWKRNIEKGNLCVARLRLEPLYLN